MKDIITIDKEVLNGTPVFKDTRVSVQTLFDYLEESSLDEFLKGHPSVSRASAEKVIEFAGKLIHSAPLEYEDTSR
ncbi:MAG TPA: DUF433 domain-containing protein [Chitinophagaceae bacterium]|nr:DUF433 domain-containing protein [Chitinophagaceae bacterium]